MDLNGKTAVITGVSRGIGRALTLQLLEKGAEVAGWGRTKPDFEHPGFTFYETNVRSLESVDAVYEATVRDHGEDIDILVNNAGLGHFGYIEEIAVEDWITMFETNVNGVFYCTRRLVPNMKARKTGHIVNISSIAGLDAMPQISGYAGTKHAVRGMTTALFKELREFGVKVTGVYPGSVKTDFFDNVESISTHDNMMSPEEVAVQIIRALETSDNFLINSLEFRPLIPKPSGS